jgi:hypothetical protein
MSKKELLKQFELPTAFKPLTDEQEYKPPRAHSESVIEALRQQPAGALVLGQQYIGAMIAGLSIDRGIKLTEKDQAFLTKIVVAAGFGSAQHSFRPGKPVMRRHLELPMLVNPDTDEILSVEDRIDKMNRQLDLTVIASKFVYIEMMATRMVRINNSHALGHIAGNASLWVALLPYPQIGSSGSGPQTQAEVREVCMGSLETTRQLGKDVGTYLSYAMLGGPVTNLTAHIEEHAPVGAYNVLDEARVEARGAFAHTI